ncbi:unnamed protein product [Alopecurus aequalis]
MAHGVGEFSIAMTDDASLRPLPPTLPPLQDLHSYMSAEELKQSIAAVRAELRATREEARRKEQLMASLAEHIRRTAQERDLLRQQHQLLLATAAPSAFPLLTSSPLVAVNRAPAFARPSSALAIDRRSTPATPEVPIFAPACPLLTSSPPVAVDRAATLAVPSSGAAIVDRGKAATALEVPTFAALVGQDKGKGPMLEVPSFAAHVGQDRSKEAALEMLADRRPLPQQGRLVSAVLEAGSLLQHQLVAGSLPRWRNPPPVQALADAMIPAPSVSVAPMGLPRSIR